MLISRKSSLHKINNAIKATEFYIKVFKDPLNDCVFAYEIRKRKL